MSRSCRAFASILCAIGIPAACAPRSTAPVEPLPHPLPELRVMQVSTRMPPPETRDPHGTVDPLARLPAGATVSLAAAAVDVTTLLVALADAAAISLVVDPDIDERITVSFHDIPAREALRLVLAESGLFIAAGPPEPPFGAVVFYSLPVDIDGANAETISARFGVSREAAEFVVRARRR